jgi:hypothetical protein
MLGGKMIILMLRRSQTRSHTYKGKRHLHPRMTSHHKILINVMRHLGLYLKVRTALTALRE